MGFISREPHGETPKDGDMEVKHMRKITKPDAMNTLYDAVHDVAHKVAYNMLHEAVTEMYETRKRVVALETEQAMMKNTMQSMAVQVERAKAELMNEMHEMANDLPQEVMDRVSELEGHVGRIIDWANEISVPSLE